MGVADELLEPGTLSFAGVAHPVFILKSGVVHIPPYRGKLRSPSAHCQAKGRICSGCHRRWNRSITEAAVEIRAIQVVQQVADVTGRLFLVVSSCGTSYGGRNPSLSKIPHNFFFFFKLVICLVLFQKAELPLFQSIFEKFATQWWMRYTFS
ncbi:hypothetical protein ISCGN_023819 [Ixodes scapularis]